MMKDGKDKRDKIIKIVLIIIIILLLIHNCNLIKKKNGEKVPSGNVNIIEITCEDNNKCDVTPDENKKDDSTKDDKKNSGTNKNGTRQNTTNGEEKKDSQGTTIEANPGTTEPTGGDVGNDGNNNDDYYDDEVTIFDSDVKWEDTTQLKIFTDSVYHLDGKIAPESSNTYQFVVKNSTKYKLNYNISFIETNPYHINMKYKLKKNDTYLVDHYVSYDELNINDQILNSKSNDTFYLEWKWVSSDHDNEAGEVEANYSLNIEVKAESV